MKYTQNKRVMAIIFTILALFGAQDVDAKQIVQEVNSKGFIVETHELESIESLPQKYITEGVPHNLMVPKWNAESHMWQECEYCMDGADPRVAEMFDAGNEPRSKVNTSSQFAVAKQFVTESAFPLELSSGAHVTRGGVWTNASSRSLKENIVPITQETALDTVLTLEPVQYNYKEEQDEVYAGFIAEDVPSIVATNDRRSLSPMDVVAVAVGAIKELWARITTMQEQITSILGRLNALEVQNGSAQNVQEAQHQAQDETQNNGEEEEDVIVEVATSTETEVEIVATTTATSTTTEQVSVPEIATSTEEVEPELAPEVRTSTEDIQSTSTATTTDA